jgi:predicted Zn-dependent protease
MKKTALQGLTLIVLFFTICFGLMQIDWLTLFKVQKITDKTEQKLGELFWDVFKKTESENTDPYVVNVVDSIVTKICVANSIDRKSITIHILNKDDVNAFAIPNGHLIIYSGLILASDNPEELAGVIAHEMAHIELNHVMKKLVKEVGLSVLISMTTGSSGEIVKETAKMLSSTAFDRSLEKEADLKAVDYLIHAKINPAPFSNFLYKLADKEHETMKYLTWASTHPDSKERAAYVIEYSMDKKVNYETVINASTWSTLLTKLDTDD